MVVMFFLPRIHAEDNIGKLNISGFDLQMRETVYKGVLFSLPDALVLFVLEVKVDNTVEKMHYLPVLAHTTVLRSSEIDWI